MHLRGGAREQPGAAVPPKRSSPWAAGWLELITLAAVAATAAACLTHAWASPLELTPLLAVPPALAGIGASTIGRPLGYGIVALIAAGVIDALLGGGVTATTGAHLLPLAAAGAVAVTTAVSITGVKVGNGKTTVDQEQQEQQIANVISVAEAAQRAVLRPLHEQLGPL